MSGSMHFKFNQSVTDLTMSVLPTGSIVLACKRAKQKFAGALESVADSATEASTGIHCAKTVFAMVYTGIFARREAVEVLT